MASKDIWTMLSTMDTKGLTPRTDEQAKAEEKDTFTLIVGEKNSGKTSLTANFRNSSKGTALFESSEAIRVQRTTDSCTFVLAEEIKPTTALDYIFVRLKTSAGGGRPAVAHMWELATNKCVNDMLRIPLAPERVLNGALVIVLDLSVPGDVVPALVKWLLILYKAVNELLKLKEKNPVDKFAVDKLKQESMARYGATHPDRDDVMPIPLPVLIVGNKYDAFRDEDSVKRKGVIQAVRYLAHLYGANVLFTSMKDKALVTQFRSVMKNFAFRCMPKGASKDVDLAKPLFVPAGADLYEDIGVPKSATRRPDQFSKEQHEERARAWKKIASEYFPPSGTVDESPDERDAKEAEENPVDKFPEPTIDRMRQQKR